MKLLIDLNKFFYDSFATFEVTKKFCILFKLRLPNMLCYDGNGELSTGSNILQMSGAENYPIVTLTDILVLIEEYLGNKIQGIKLFKLEDKYFFEFEEIKVSESQNIVDCLILGVLKLTDEGFIQISN